MRSLASRLCAALFVLLFAVWALAASGDSPRPADAEARARARAWFAPWAGFPDWDARARRDLDSGRRIGPERFDQLFDDAFFSGREDPFALIERFDKRFADLLDEPDREAFGRSWRDWRRDRIGLGSVKERVETTDDSVILSFEIPGLDSSTVKLDVAKGRVRLSYDARRVEEKTDAKGRVVARSESATRFEKVVPIPAQADPEKYRVEKKGEVIRLIFERDRGDGPRT